MKFSYPLTAALVASSASASLSPLLQNTATSVSLSLALLENSLAVAAPVADYNGQIEERSPGLEARKKGKGKKKGSKSKANKAAATAATDAAAGGNAAGADAGGVVKKRFDGLNARAKGGRRKGKKKGSKAQANQAAATAAAGDAAAAAGTVRREATTIEAARQALAARDITDDLEVSDLEVKATPTVEKRDVADVEDDDKGDDEGASFTYLKARAPYPIPDVDEDGNLEATDEEDFQARSVPQPTKMAEFLGL